MPADKSDRPVIEIRDVSKHFSRKRAVGGISLDVFPGEAYALVGPNGAGKTTLLKMLVGLLRPDTGSLTIMGHDITSEPLAAKRQFGYVSDNPSAYDYLTGREFLEFTGRLRGMDAVELAHRVTEVSNLFPIRDLFDEPMRSYSRGNRQKLAVLAAILTRPPLMLIDEPIVGLDPESIDILGGLMTSYRNHGGTVFFVTHILQFAQKYATRVGLMHRGILVTSQPVSPKVSLDTLFEKIASV